jgi:DNA topoisomerase-1
MRTTKAPNKAAKQPIGGGYTLIITEKPSAAKRIADALAEGEPDEIKGDGASYFRIRRKGRELVVVSAAGHLFSLSEKERSAVWTYPVFSVEWKPTWESNRAAAWSRKYYDTIKSLARGANGFISSCDFDIEGSVIAFNIIRFLCGASDGRRMRFSTLTKQDLTEAYDSASEHLDFPQIDAGLARHHLDFLWGINMSRALTLALQAAGGYKTLSTGRVQGPVLELLNQKQKEIEAFKPTPFWELHLKGKLSSEEIDAIHVKGQFWEKKEAEKALDRCKGKDAVVDAIDTKQYMQKPPVPFDLTTLQRDAYVSFHYSPKQTLDIAQSLYEQAVISYPRTSSQKLPDKLGFKAIINSLWKQPAYKHLCENLLKKGSLKPNEGPKADPAHPAIYPTGAMPKALNNYQRNVYDMITRRFLATFAEPAKRESVKITVDVSGEKFAAEGARTLEQGWIEFYKPYVKLKEQPMPACRKGDEVSPYKVAMFDKETQPPNRFTQASILKEMEKLGLGTKGTRAMILQTLYDRGYIEGDSIAVTKLGSSVIGALDKYCPEIISVDLTKRFEKEMEEIQEGALKPETVIAEAEVELKKILEKFKSSEKSIGGDLLQIVREAAREESTLGKCMTCKEGELVMRNSKAGKRFVGCSNYPKCTQTFSLPQNGYITKLKEVCPKCGLSILSIKGKGRRPWKLCIKDGFVNNRKSDDLRNSQPEVANAKKKEGDDAERIVGAAADKAKTKKTRRTKVKKVDFKTSS